MLTFAIKKKRTPSIAPKRHAPTVSPMSHSLHLKQAKVRHILRGPTLQPKLKIGQPDDKYEQEADRVADEVMRMPEPGVQRQVEPEEEKEEEEETLQPKPLANQITPLVQVQRQEEPEETPQTKPLAEQITPLVQRQVEPEEEEPIQTKLIDDAQVQRQEEEEEPIMTKGITGSAYKIRNDLSARLNLSRSGGQPLPETDRSFMERRFGVDFSSVRVHTDSNAAQISREINAQAFTYGRDIYFGEWRYRPGTLAGKKLLAHELTHVAQQGGKLLKRVQMKKTITIKRDIDIGNSNCCVPNQTSCCTLGKASIDGQDVGYTLELSNCNNQRNVSRIPPGTYPTTEENHSHFKYCLRLDGVCGRSGILIHAGNSPKDTTGCILPGKTRKTKSCWVSQSRDALKHYKKIINSDTTIETVIQLKFRNKNDFKNIRFPIIQRHGKHSSLTTPLQKYLHTLQHAKKTQKQWQGGLIKNAKFLSFPIVRGIHSELKTRLNIAENHFKTKYPNLSDTQIINNIGIYRITGLRKPGTAVSGSKISYHAFGLAIDVNYKGNPFIARSKTVANIIKRATLLVLGKEINIRIRPPSGYTISQLVERYKKASDALKKYFNFRSNSASLTNRLSKLSSGLKSELIKKSLPTDTTGWLKLIKADYTNTTLQKEFASRDPASGFIDLKKELVVALVSHAGLLWGGQYRTGKDFMHFDWRKGTIKNKYRV